MVIRLTDVPMHEDHQGDVTLPVLTYDEVTMLDKKRKLSVSPTMTRKKPAFNENKAKRAEGPPATVLWSVDMVRSHLLCWNPRFEFYFLDLTRRITF